ncbi:MAG: DUF1289 domain-containing protein [Candidatus Sericytochromatia bacterium]|nr:DUF1289 domain-containing protein [Candidatus Sericytochromatia bacterium]
MEPASPCIRRCELSPRRDVCLGCHRTCAEIAAWSSLDAAGKRQVLARIARRTGARSHGPRE